jgi:hypothetical protein
MLRPMGEAATPADTLDRFLALLDRLGAWGSVAVSTVSALVIYGWSAAAGMPRSIAAVIAIYALAGAFWLYASLLEMQRQRRKSASLPDYEKWNLVTTFTFAQAASLWADRRPELQLDDSAYAIYRMLKEQAQSGGLDALAEGPDFHRGSLVLRGDLVRLARRVKQRPRFLFNRHVR